MSAETEIINLLDHAKNNASSLSASSLSMTNAAIIALEDTVEFPQPPYGITPGNKGKDFEDELFDNGTDDGKIIESTVSGFPSWPKVEFDELPDLQELNGIKLTENPFWASRFPNLEIPSFRYPFLTRPQKFDKTVPLIDPTIEYPISPDTNIPFTPTVLPLDSVTPIYLQVDGPEFTGVDVDVSFDSAAFSNAFDRIMGNIFGGKSGMAGINDLLEDLGSWSESLLDSLLPGVLSVISRQFSNKYSTVLRFQNKLEQRLNNRLADEQDRVIEKIANDQSGWDLPQAVQQALKRKAQQVADAWRQQMQGQVSVKSMELALQFFEVCGTLFAGLNQGVQSLKAKEIEYTLEAHKMAVAYARQVVKALLAQYEAENFTKQDIEFQKAEALLKLFEAELQIAMLRYDEARANLQVEEALQNNDMALVKNYRTEVENAERSVKLYAAKVSAARSELELKKLPFEIFELEVKKFDAQMSVYQAEVNRYKAEIEKDNAKLEGSLAEIRVFEAQVRGFEKKIDTSLAIANAQIDRNAAVISEFEAKTKALFAPTEKSLLTNQYELKKYQIESDNALADAELALADAKAQVAFNNGLQDGALEAYRLTQERNLELMNVELERLRAISEINSKGAGIMANMAQGAMSAANGVASVIFEESV